MVKSAFGSVACVASLALLAVGCGESDEGTGAAAEPLQVVAAFYPLEEAARAIGGERVAVTSLTPPGQGPHDVELTTDAAAQLEAADAVVYLGAGFQPSVEDAVAALDDDVVVADLLESVELRTVDDAIPGVEGDVDGEVLAGRKDPHVWVDPARFAELAEEITDALVEADPEGAAVYEENAEAYIAQLRKLDASFEERLAPCKGAALVTSHAAFGYLTDRYGLIQAPIAGISPDDEPSPKSLAATAAFAKEHGVTTVFFETLVPKDLAETVAQEIGADTDALDPVEGIPQDALADGATYVTIQEDNLDRLVRGLGCTDG